MIIVQAHLRNGRPVKEHKRNLPRNHWRTRMQKPSPYYRQKYNPTNTKPQTFRDQDGLPVKREPIGNKMVNHWLSTNTRGKL